jgi:hypothetical protein
MSHCPECESENIETIDIGRVCLSCGFEMGYEEDEPWTLDTVPIDRRFNLYMDRVFGNIGDKNISGSEVVEKLRPYMTRRTSCNDLRRIMRNLGLNAYYDSIPAIYSLLKRNKIMNITVEQKRVLSSDYRQFIKKYKELICDSGRGGLPPRKKLPKQELILKSLLLKNNIPFENDMFSELQTKGRKEENNREFQKVFNELGWNPTSWNFIPI